MLFRSVMEGTLKLLHPFMPFITEEIWQALPHEGESIMVSAWPVYTPSLAFAKEEADFEKVMDAIRAVRNRRAEMNVPPSRKAQLCIATGEPEVFEQGRPFLQRLASASEVTVADSFTMEGAVQVITNAARIFIPMDELVDKEKELARLNKEKEKVEKEIGALSKKLDNPGFVSKAPAAVVEGERAKLQQQKERLARIEESIAVFQ